MFEIKNDPAHECAIGAWHLLITKARSDADRYVRFDARDDASRSVMLRTMKHTIDDLQSVYNDLFTSMSEDRL